tara:strand:+ start:360 stop:584 length:225 start_codon:yes stop_codon:yes gene_type:complete
MEVKDFIGEKVTYDNMGQMIWGNKDGDTQLILSIRGWGAIQKLFDTGAQAVDFQDKMGNWIVDAINEKLLTPTK